MVSWQLHNSAASITLSHFGRTPKENIRIILKRKTHVLPISLKKPPFEKTNLDWLIVCIKEHHYNEALASLAKLVGSTTKIAIIRNGLRLKDPFLSFVNEANILECQIDCPCQPVSDDCYQSFKDPVITTPQSLLASEFSTLFSSTATQIRPAKDFKTESWKKVCESSSLGAILCLSGESCWIFEDSKLQELYLNLLEEGLEVARADGAQIESGFTKQMLAKLLAHPKTKGSSMLTDRINGRSIELGAKNKIITDIGKQYRVATPLNDMVVTLLSSTNRSSLENS